MEASGQRPQSPMRSKSQDLVSNPSRKVNPTTGQKHMTSV